MKYIIFEVTKGTSGSKYEKEIKTPVGEAGNAPAADSKIKSLTDRLTENQEIRDRIYSELIHKHRGNEFYLSEKDRAVYQKVKDVHNIIRYERVALDETLVEKTNPVNAQEAEPEKPKTTRKRKTKKKPAAKATSAKAKPSNSTAKKTTGK